MHDTPSAKGRSVESSQESLDWLTDGHARARDFLTPAEIEKLLKATKATGRNKTRNHLLTLMLYRHGLRVSEACDFRVDYLDLKQARLWVQRCKDSISTYQPIQGDELRLIRRHLRERKQPDSPFLFTSEQGGPLDRHTVNKMLAVRGKTAGIPIKVTPHVLRHSCGYYLANETNLDIRAIQEYLGHKNIKNTVRYTRINNRCFLGIWR